MSDYFKMIFIGILLKVCKYYVVMFEFFFCICWIYWFECFEYCIKIFSFFGYIYFYDRYWGWIVRYIIEVKRVKVGRSGISVFFVMYVIMVFLEFLKGV